MRDELIQSIKSQKVIAIIRGVYGDECVKLAQALYAGGITLIEVTYDQSRQGGLTDTTETIRQLVSSLKGKMTVGAGTALSSGQVDMAFEAGGQFIVSPDVNADVIQRTRSLGMISIPGAMTPTEVLNAYKLGADFVKVFPANNLGAAYIKALRSPINHVPLLVVGGISENNVAEFLAAGAAGAGVGGKLVNKEWIRAGQFFKITETARQLVENARQLRNA